MNVTGVTNYILIEFTVSRGGSTCLVLSMVSNPWLRSSLGQGVKPTAINKWT